MPLEWKPNRDLVGVGRLLSADDAAQLVAAVQYRGTLFDRVETVQPFGSTGAIAHPVGIHRVDVALSGPDVRPALAMSVGKRVTLELENDEVVTGVVESADRVRWGALSKIR